MLNFSNNESEKMILELQDKNFYLEAKLDGFFSCKLNWHIWKKIFVEQQISYKKISPSSKQKNKF